MVDAVPSCDMDSELQILTRIIHDRISRNAEGGDAGHLRRHHDNATGQTAYPLARIPGTRPHVRRTLVLSTLKAHMYELWSRM